MLPLLLLMSASIGVIAYSAGILPLSFSSSKNVLNQFSLLGSGLLVGTALGVILPEGVEAIVRTSGDKQEISPMIALPLIVGFAFMLLLDQVISPHAHFGTETRFPVHHSSRTVQSDTTVDFDAELTELERQEMGSGEETSRRGHTPSVAGISGDVASARKKGMAITLGLFVHALADGIALGVSSLTDTISTSLSMVVFLALVVHKAPTSLALASSLLSAGLPREECKKHILIFASATPTGALVSFLLFSFLGNRDASWTGTALLASGGTFLYVATVLQTASYHAAPADITRMGRVLYILAGIVLPFVLSAILGHHH
ncbi:Zinc/iron permease [Amanita rubescens]|nr:Zinc/iron permease [Amanita rubescens]